MAFEKKVMMTDHSLSITLALSSIMLWIFGVNVDIPNEAIPPFWELLMLTLTKIGWAMPVGLLYMKDKDKIDAGILKSFRQVKSFFRIGKKKRKS